MTMTMPVLFATELPFDLGNVATGVSFGALTWYLVSSVIPKMFGGFREDLKEERLARQADAEKIAGKLERVETRQGEMVGRLDKIEDELSRIGSANYNQRHQGQGGTK